MHAPSVDCVLYGFGSQLFLASVLCDSIRSAPCHSDNSPCHVHHQSHAFTASQQKLAEENENVVFLKVNVDEAGVSKF